MDRWEHSQENGGQGARAAFSVLYCSRTDGLRAHDVDILIKVMGCLRTVLTFNGDMLVFGLF